MKTFYKVSITVSGIMITLGIILCIVAFALGVSFYNMPQTGNASYSDSYGDATSLSFEFSAADVKIIRGESFSISARNIVNNNFKSEIQNGTWIIKESEHSGFFSNLRRGIYIGGFSVYHPPEIEVQLPSDFTAKNIDISIGAGKITIDSLSSQEADLEVGAGSLSIDRFTSDSARIDCGVGSVKINGYIKSSGNFHCGIGEIKMNLSGRRTDYNYDVDVGLGNAKINGENYSGVSSKSVKNENASGNFKIDCGIGSIELNFD